MSARSIRPRTRLANWDALRSLAAAQLRRFERAPSEVWEHEALRVARAFLSLFDRDDVTRMLTAPLLSVVASLPTRDAEGLRGMLMRGHLALPEGGLVSAAVAPGDLVIDVHGRLDVIARRAPQPSASWLAEQQFAPRRRWAAPTSDR